MPVCKTVMHVVQSGDTFYRLAQQYNTTVPEIIVRNPGINPYNLPIGTKLTICAGPNYNSVQKDELQLNNDMRKAWEQHVFWTRMYMISLLEGLGDLSATEARLMQNPQDIADVFASFYPQPVVTQLSLLLTEHLQIGSELMKALQAGNMQEAEQLERQWYMNADKIAARLSSINSFFTQEDVKDALYTHLDLLKREIIARLNKQYEEEIRLFDENENHILELADYLTDGIIMQFYKARQI